MNVSYLPFCQTGVKRLYIWSFFSYLQHHYCWVKVYHLTMLTCLFGRLNCIYIEIKLLTGAFTLHTLPFLETCCNFPPNWIYIIMFTAAQLQQDVFVLDVLDVILVRNYPLRCRFSVKLCQRFHLRFPRSHHDVFLQK